MTVPNRAPVKVGDVSAQSVNKKSSKGVSVSGKFSDADMDSLSYTASSSNTSKVSVTVSGSTVTIRGVSQTSSAVTVRVTASDGHGGTAQLSFGVTVPNRAPVKVGDVSAQTVYKGESRDVSVEGKFSDADMDGLTYTASSSDTSKVTERMSGNTVRITGVSAGVATVTVTADDKHGGTATLSFEVTVKCPPAADGTIPAQSVYKKATKTVTVSGYFDNCNGDPLTYTASSSDTSKVKVSNGATVTLTGVSQTSSAVTVTVTASDGTRTAQQTFDVEVPNRDPEKEGTIADQTVSKGSSKQLTVSGYFSDPDMDRLRYSARSSATGKATVSVSGSKVTISGVAEGTATVTVTAEDDHGGEVDQEFDVTVTVPTPSISSISPPLQPPDTQVTISGSNFGSSQGSVSFGGDSVTDISSWSNTSIRCFIPVFASAGTVSVTVTTSGNKTSSGYSYTITGRSPVRGQCGDEEGCEGEEEPEKEGSGSEEGGDSEGSEDPPGDAG